MLPAWWSSGSDAVITVGVGGFSAAIQCLEAVDRVDGTDVKISVPKGNAARHGQVFGDRGCLAVAERPDPAIAARTGEQRTVVSQLKLAGVRKRVREQFHCEALRDAQAVDLGFAPGAGREQDDGDAEGGRVAKGGHT